MQLHNKVNKGERCSFSSIYYKRQLHSHDEELWMYWISFISGIRLTSTVLPSDTQAAKALYPFPGHQIDIFSNSWGPPDTGYIVAGPGPLTQLALQTGTSKVLKAKDNMDSI